MIENNLIDRENAVPEEKGIYNFSVKGAGESEDIRTKKNIRTN